MADVPSPRTSIDESSTRGASPADPDAPIHLRRATYDSLLGSRFRVSAEGHDLDATLVEVSERSPAGTRGRDGEPFRETFALVFETTDRSLLRQGVYLFQEPSLDPFTLFMTPIGNGADGYLHEAVINRLSP